MKERTFVDPPDDDSKEFYADSPKGVIKNTQNQGGAGANRGVEAPQNEIETHREIAYTDPHVHEAVYTLIDWIGGDSYNIKPRSFEAALEGGSGEIAADITSGAELGDEEAQRTMAAKLEMLMKSSRFQNVFIEWLYYAVVDGHSFMELVVEDGNFDPRLLPTANMSRETDEYGRVIAYHLDPPEGGGGGGGGGGDNRVSYEPHEVAELYFRKQPTEDFGRSFIEPIAEAADILRDMEMDYARFVATKAYPPILWKLGTEDEKWTEPQIDNWLDTVEAIEPDTMLAAGHDVEADIVGTTSTSSTAGAMRLEETFDHFQDRIVTGLGVPALLMNMEGGSGGQGEAISAMPSFKRRVRRIQNHIKTEVEQQILKSLVFNSLQDAEGPVPEFEFGEYSSAEERLDSDVAINLMNNLLLKPEAAARRAGIDPDSELPDIWEGADGEQQMEILRQLAGSGDDIQNPDGGSPTGTGGGAESSGGEVTSRQNPGGDEDGRNRQSVTESENT